MNTTWYLHSHFVWLRLSNSSILDLLFVCLAAHDWEFPRWTPVSVKLLLPPRQSRGVSRYRLGARLARTCVGNEPLHEFADTLARCRVRHFAVRVDHLRGVCNEQTTARPQVHTERAQHRKPCVLRQDGAEPS